MAVITRAGKPPFSGTGYRLFLNLLDGRTCELRKKAPIEFPSKTDRADHHAFPEAFAAGCDLARSDESRVSYGMFQSPDGVAYFVIFSLADGRLFATLRGDTNRGGFWNAIFHSTEELWATGAPAGMLIFTPNSRELVATSEHIYQWDVSMLR